MVISNRYKLLSITTCQLLQYGKEWPEPQGPDYFRTRCKNAFLRNSKETDEAKIQQMIQKGDYVVKEIEALYKLKKYRTMKRRYGLDKDN